MGAAAAGNGGFSRRGFFLGAGGLAGAAVLWLNRKHLTSQQSEMPSFSGRTAEIKAPEHAMPGPFPGRVVEVRHPGSVNDRNVIQAGPVREMMGRGMCELTGADHSQEAWRRFFEPGDVVGIKVNPVGYRRPYRPDAVPSVSSPEVLLEIVAGLKSAGVKARDIVVFERYASEFREAGYEKVMLERAMDGVRWYAGSSGNDHTQLEITGRARREELDPHVVGYDPDVFVHMGYADANADPKDDRRFRSHLTVIVTRMVNKFITIPVLKDHRSAGVTLALKNLSHGFNNNVARSHISNQRRLGLSRSDPNQCNTFIPTAVDQGPLRQKGVLHIMDGLVGVYEGGPGCWNGTWATWRHKGLFFATDPVAMDHVGWDIIDAKRATEGWAPVARMGMLYQAPPAALSRQLAVLAATRMPYPLTGHAIARHVPGQDGEAFDRREPEHVVLAGTIGLGVFDARAIEYRRIELRA